MNAKLIFMIISYVLIISILCFIPFNRKRIIKYSGEQIYSLGHNSILKTIFVNIVCVFLIFIVYKMDYNLLISFALSGCGVFGSFIFSKDGGLSTLDGVYENALICNGNFIKYSDILEFPVFKLSKEDRALYAGNSLIIVTKKKTKIELAFKSEEECRRVVAQLVQMKIIKK